MITPGWPFIMLSTLPRRFLVWIDRVGVYQVCCADAVTIGGPVSERKGSGPPGRDHGLAGQGVAEPASVPGPANEGGNEGGEPEPVADVSLLAPLSRCHATFTRSGERYIFEPHATSFLAGRPVLARTDLGDRAELQLGQHVKLRFRLPNAMSGTARVEILSNHRPRYRCDGIILLADTCLLGAGEDHHIRCPGWSGSVLLVRRPDGLWCQSREEMFLNGDQAPQGGYITHDTQVTVPDGRFRVEYFS